MRGVLLVGALGAILATIAAADCGVAPDVVLARRDLVVGRAVEEVPRLTAVSVGMTWGHLGRETVQTIGPNEYKSIEQR